MKFPKPTLLIAFLSTLLMVVGACASNETDRTTEQQIGGATVTTNQSTYSSGQDVTVSWTGMPGNATDWVAIVTAGSPPDSGFVQWNYINGQVSGSMVFSGIANGNYEARGYQSGTFTVLASSTFSIVAGSPTVTTDQSMYSTGQPVTVTWTGMPGNATDWVAIVTAGSPPDSGFIQWRYINSQVNGSTVFAGIANGNYEARAYQSGTFTVLSSATFSIASGNVTISTDQSTYSTGQPITVSWTGMPGNPDDFVAIVTAGSPPDSGFVQWAYVNGQVSGSMAFSNIPNGSYEARAYLSGTFTVLASSTFTVTVACTSAPVRPVFASLTSGDLVISATQTENSAVVSVPLTSSILFTSVAENEPSPAYGTVICSLLATGVTCDRQTAGTDSSSSLGQITIHYTVVTFTSGVSVQRGVASTGFSDPDTVTLSTVDPTQSFVLLNGIYNGGTGWGNNEFVEAQLVDAQTLNLQTNVPGTAVSWQVVSMVGASVQRGITSFASGDLQQQPAITTAPAGSLVLASYSTDGSGIAAATLMLQSSLMDPNTLLLKRDLGGSALEVSWEVVSLPFATDSGLSTFQPGQTTQAPFVSGIVGTSSVAICSSQSILGQSTGSTSYAGSEFDLVGEAAVTLSTQTGSITLTRATSQASAEIPWTVIDFAHDCTGM